MTSRSPAPERLASPPGLSQTVCLSYCSNRIGGRRSPGHWDSGEPGHERRGLEADRHLVAVVLAVDRGAVDARPDLDAKDHPVLRDPASLFRRVGMVIAAREPGRTLDHG